MWLRHEAERSARRRCAPRTAEELMQIFERLLDAGAARLTELENLDARQHVSDDVEATRPDLVDEALPELVVCAALGALGPTNCAVRARADPCVLMTRHGGLL